MNQEKLVFCESLIPLFGSAWEVNNLVQLCPKMVLNFPLLAPGISLKTQELYVIVFVTRYLDLFTRYISLYNSVMKLVFLGTSIAIVWYMRYHKVVKQTYSKQEDTFRHYFLVLPCFVLALLIHRSSSVTEVWSIPSLLLSF
ncbi:ER lumen protein-retaining receptor B [Vitis vinifera]|uniref:ER lumen protein-retaining receptor B n=1 Tax=Vitis vinifera TaxID=29760 RepID=A0A438IY70_VITVI|nr:ER lumen protein-retaining receptor B [Vitis vinifera]